MKKGISSIKWWFFDTNCISEIVKIWKRGRVTQVREFVSARQILLTSTIIQELRNAPGILKKVGAALENAKLFLIPDMTRFWYTETLNFRDPEPPSFVDSLRVRPIPPGFFELVPEKAEFEQACVEAEADVRDRFLGTIDLDIGSNLDERDLCIFIFNVVNKLGREWLQVDVRPEDCTAFNFPSFYAFYYTYYFRYAKNQVRPEINDFIDLANCLALPCCERYYGERKFTTILRDHVQGRVPPTAFRLAKRLHKLGEIDRRTLRVISRHKSKFIRTASLLPEVEIFNYTEMCEQIRTGS